MAWGDILGGIGAAAGGVQDAYRYEKDLRARQELARQQEELRVMLAKIGAESRENVAETGAQAKRDVAERNARTKITVQELVNTSDLEEIKSKGEWDTKIQELRNKGKINEVEAEGLYRTNIAEINRQIAAARDLSNERRATTAANATTEAARTAAQSRVDVANVNQSHADTRSEKELAQKGYGLELRYRYPHGPGAWMMDPSDIKPFGPSWGEYQSTAKPQAAPARPAPRPDLLKPPSFDQFNVGPMFKSSPSMPSMNAPSAPSAPSSSTLPLGTPPPAAAMAPRVGTTLAPRPSEQEFGAALTQALGPPTRGTPPVLDPSYGDPGSIDNISRMSRGMIGPPAAPAAAPLAPSPAAPPVAAKPPQTEERLQQQARDVMAQIQAANQKGEFQRARALKQILEDLLKQ